MPLSAILPSRTSSHRPGLRPRRGVTLVEIGIVMIVMGLLAAMMIPKIGSGIASRQLDRVSQQLVTDLRTAGQLATRHRRPVRFEAVGTTGYQIIDTATTTKVYVKRNFGAVSGANATFGTLPTLDFYPNGILGTTSSSVTFPAAMTVTVNGKSRQVTVSRVGFVRRP